MTNTKTITIGRITLIIRKRTRHVVRRPEAPVIKRLPVRIWEGNIMIIKRFKNGNFNVKHEPEYDYSDDLIEQLCNSNELDFTIAGDEGSAGNYDMYYPLFNHNTGMLYLPTGRDCTLYKQGRAVKLYAMKLTQTELNEIVGGLER